MNVAHIGEHRRYEQQTGAPAVGCTSSFLQVSDVLTLQSIESGTHRYSFGAEDGYVQYRYSSLSPWRYLSALGAALCRRVRRSSIVFSASGGGLARAALAQTNSNWARPSGRLYPSSDLVLESESTSILYPTTRDGVERAAELLAAEAGSCRLVHDRDYRNRIFGGELDADSFLAECDREWILEIVADYAVFEVVEGRWFLSAVDVLARCVQDTNDDYS